MGFSPDTKGRAFIAVVQVQNMKKMGLSEEQYEDPEFLANYLLDLWSGSGKDRTGAVAVCESQEGLYHAHLALYGNSTTLKCVADVLFQSHVEPQLGGKAALSNYLLKQGKYEEKGEKVLYVKGIENIQDVRGKRSDMGIIEEELLLGKTPQQILDKNFSFYKYENLIMHAYIDQRIRDAPTFRKVYVEIHIGDSGTGKTYVYNQLCTEYGSENIYILTDYDNNASGALDSYMKMGAPPILFMDEFRGVNFPYSKLLSMLSGYTRMQTHSRYSNTYNLWEKVYITSVYPPEVLYENMVREENRKIDSMYQMMRRIDKIVYHYIKDKDYRTYTMDAKDYSTFEDLRNKVDILCKAEDGFVEVSRFGQQKLPFDD